jgi:transcriptional regulator GlxA family with amidase domain
MEMLRAAEDIYRVAHRQKKPFIKKSIVTLDGKPITTSGGILITPNAAIDDISHCDFLLLPALWRNPSPIVNQHSKLTHRLQTLPKTTAICAVSTGVWFPAHAGLLNGIPATTHWHWMDAFAAEFPAVSLKRKYLITQGNNIYCAGSVNAIADLMIYFIERYYSNAIAQAVEGQFSPEIRRPWNRQIYQQESFDNHDDETVIAIQDWLQANIANSITMSTVAKRFDMSLRSFNRHFKQATGTTPLYYLQKLRVDTAQDLLRTTNLSITEISYRVGYNDSAYFSRLFQKHFSTTPQRYRYRVRSKLFATSQESLPI